MTIQYLYQTEYVVTTEAERDLNWPQYSRVRCLDTSKTYRLISTSWVEENHSGGTISWGGIGGTLSNQTDLQNALNAKAASGHSHAESDVTNLVTDLAAKQATLTRNTGNIVHANLSNGTLTMAFGTNSSVKVTPTATGTFTTTVPAAGCVCYLKILTSGTTSYTITFGTGFKSTGTLATGKVTGKVFTLVFISDGTTCNQIARSTAM